MIRSPVGVSNISVSPEVDPGFGPDTEQKRVEFAAKLEEEAFAISVGDATKIAKANMVTALKLWGKEDLIPLMEKLTLRDIMLIWLMFELCYLLTVWKQTLDEENQNTVSLSKKHFAKLIQKIFAQKFDTIKKKIFNIEFSLKKLQQIRKDYGGDLIFTLKKRNDLELVQQYQYAYSKLPKSLRLKYFNTIVGAYLLPEELMNVLHEKKKREKAMVTLVREKIGEDEEYELTEHAKKSMLHILNIFDTSFAKIAKQIFTTKYQEDTKNVKEKVKSYYGIDKD